MMKCMIHESSYWKDDLIRLADRLELRLVQTRWGSKNLYTLEKEIFIGFYSVRKLIESNKISNSIISKKYEVKEFLYNGNLESIMTYFKTSDYNFSNCKKSQISISILCNQFIHSYHFIPFLPNGKNLIGFFFCSDYKRTSGIYFITLFDIVDIYRKVGNNNPKSFTISRSSNGKIITKIE